MTRTEALATITAQLAKLDDTRITAVAEMVTEIADQTGQVRPLTPRELALVAQSKDDFANGRTSTLEQSEAFVEAELGRRRAARAKA